MSNRDDGTNSGDAGRSPDELMSQVRFLEAEVTDLRRRLSEGPLQPRGLELRLADTQRSLAAVTAQNERLASTLREARDQITTLKEEVDRLAQPPAGFGTFLARNDDDSVDVFTGGRKLRVSVSPAVDLDVLRKGQEVMLNEALNVVAALEFEQVGEVVMFKELLADGDRVLVIANADEERVVRLAAPLKEITLRAGDSLLLDSRAGYVYERVPKSEVEELVLEEVPDIDYSDIGGLFGQIETIRDAVELPYLHPELFVEHELKPPKGVLLYGPPGCGKTLIAKAVANSLAKKVAARTGQEGKSYFLNIKGPELLNKYVGETERHIRLVFQRAREKASEGTPVIVFFDEMDSLFRTRGSGVSSDVENTIVPQLLERDRRRRAAGERPGHRRLQPRGHDRPGHPAPGPTGREDQDRAPRRGVGTRHLQQVPHRSPAAARRRPARSSVTTARRASPGMIQATVERMYTETEENRFLEVTYANGDKEVLYFKDFNSGAMIQNIVDRAKKMAIKDLLDHEQRGLRISHLLQACVDEFKENEDLPNTTNPDDWARISGKKGERIVFIRTLITGKQGTEPGRSIDTVPNTGQYL